MSQTSINVSRMHYYIPLSFTRYKIQETLFNVGLHNTETLAQ